MPTDDYEKINLLVGLTLSMWSTMESRLADTFCALVCAERTPTDAALIVFRETRDFGQRAKLLRKAFDQTLFDDRFNEARKELQKKLSRLLTLSELRNKFAHGVCFAEDDKTAHFYPYFIYSLHTRQKHLREQGFASGAIARFEMWTVEETHQKHSDLHECIALVSQVEDLVINCYREHREFILQKPRSLLSLGIPFDQPEAMPLAHAERQPNDQTPPK